MKTLFVSRMTITTRIVNKYYLNLIFISKFINLHIISQKRVDKRLIIKYYSNMYHGS